MELGVLSLFVICKFEFGVSAATPGLLVPVFPRWPVPRVTATISPFVAMADLRKASGDRSSAVRTRKTRAARAVAAKTSPEAGPRRGGT